MVDKLINFMGEMEVLDTDKVMAKVFTHGYGRALKDVKKNRGDMINRRQYE